MARYSLRVFGESLGVVFPIDHPSVKAAASIKGFKKRKTAPPVDTEFIIALERFTASKLAPIGMRLYSALFVLLAHSSLRFGDTRQTHRVWNSGSALCCVSVYCKNPDGELLTWATPVAGLVANSGWFNSILRFWEKVCPTNPKSGQFTTLLPCV